MPTPRTIWPFDKVKIINPFEAPRQRGFRETPPCPEGTQEGFITPYCPSENHPGLWEPCGPPVRVCVPGGWGWPNGIPVPSPLNPRNLARAEAAARAADAELRSRGSYLGVDLNDAEKALILKHLR